MKGIYLSKFGMTHATCIHCGFVYDTALGNYDSEYEVFRIAEDLHDDNKPKCKKRKLIIELSHLRYEVEFKQK